MAGPLPDLRPVPRRPSRALTRGVGARHPHVHHVPGAPRTNHVAHAGPEEAGGQRGGRRGGAERRGGGGAVGGEERGGLGKGSGRA